MPAASKARAAAKRGGRDSTTWPFGGTIRQISPQLDRRMDPISISITAGRDAGGRARITPTSG